MGLGEADPAKSFGLAPARFHSLRYSQIANALDSTNLTHYAHPSSHRKYQNNLITSRLLDKPCSAHYVFAGASSCQEAARLVSVPLAVPMMMEGVC